MSLLSLVRTIGHDGATTEELPPFEFGYAPFLPERQTFTTLEADGAPMPPRSLADEEFETVSLFNNGLTDVVQLGTSARFWRNLGGGRYDAPQPLTELPANVRLRNPGTQLADMTGNGRADLLVLDSNGYFPMSFLGRWSVAHFVSYQDAPSVTFDDAELRLVDLDGDGVADALRTGIDLELYRNDPVKGWQPPELRPRGPLDEFPDLSFSDPRVKLADLTGDGLQDIVLVDQGRIDYWPYLGHGRGRPRDDVRQPAVRRRLAAELRPAPRPDRRPRRRRGRRHRLRRARTAHDMDQPGRPGLGRAAGHPRHPAASLTSTPCESPTCSDRASMACCGPPTRPAAAAITGSSSSPRVVSRTC